MKLVLLAVLLCLPMASWSEGFADVKSGFTQAPAGAPGSPANLASGLELNAPLGAMDTRSALLDYRAHVAARGGDAAAYNRIGNINLYLLLVLLLFAVTRRALYD